MKFYGILFYILLSTLVTACADTKNTVPRPSSASNANAPKPVASHDDILADTVKKEIQKETPPDDTDIFPENLIDRPVRVAIMLPLSGPEEKIGEAFLNAASMALFDAYDPRITLLPFDTKGTAKGAKIAAQQALAENIDIVLGPLFSDSIKTAAPLVEQAGKILIGFSSDRNVAQPGRFIMGFSPEGEVRRVLQYATQQGHTNFAALIPVGLYGQRVSAALGDILESTKIRIMALEEYEPSADSVFAPVKRLARYDERKRLRDEELRALKALDTDMSAPLIKELQSKEVLGDVNYSAILVPEGGQLLRTIAPLLPYYEIDPGKVKLLGTGLWNDPSLLQESSLKGAWFAAPDPAKPVAFLQRYQDTYGQTPPRIVTIAYDAMALIAYKMRHPVAEERFSLDSLLDQKGFHGIDGLFRFKKDGTVERALAVLEIQPVGFQIIDKAPLQFQRFEHYAIRPSGQ